MSSRCCLTKNAENGSFDENSAKNEHRRTRSSWAWAALSVRPGWLSTCVQQPIRLDDQHPRGHRFIPPRADFRQPGCLSPHSERPVRTSYQVNRFAGRPFPMPLQIVTESNVSEFAHHHSGIRSSKRVGDWFFRTDGLHRDAPCDFREPFFRDPCLKSTAGVASRAAADFRIP